MTFQRSELPLGDRLSHHNYLSLTHTHTHLLMMGVLIMHEGFSKVLVSGKVNGLVMDMLGDLTGCPVVDRSTKQTIRY